MENKEVEKQCELAVKRCPNNDLRVFFIALLASIIVVAGYHLTRMVVRHYRVRNLARYTCPCRKRGPFKFHKGRPGKPGRPFNGPKCGPAPCAPAPAAPAAPAPAPAVKPAPAPAPAPAAK